MSNMLQYDPIKNTTYLENQLFKMFIQICGQKAKTSLLSTYCYENAVDVMFYYDVSAPISSKILRDIWFVLGFFWYMLMTQN